VPIRRLTASDVDVLRKVRLDALRTDPDAFGSTLEREEGRPDEDWVRWVTSRSAMFVAEDAGEPVGLAGGIVDDEQPDRAVLVSVWVAPASRNQGIGRALVAAVVDWATASGKQRVDLLVIEGNAAAIALYERCGFALTGDHVQRDRDQKTELFMSRGLA
jgi:ribosomal protein S18 acetylase RimI-like enzyme